MPHKYFEVDGVAAYVHHRGPTTLPGAAPVLERGEVVLCLHGSGGNGGQFRALLDELAVAHSPLAVDQPGHGRSGGLDSLGSVEGMGAFVAHLMDRLELRRTVLFGHSLGGAVALWVAMKHRERVRALVLCGTGLRFPGSDESIALMKKVSQGKARRPFDRSAFAADASREVMGAAFAESLKTDPRATYGDLLAARAWNPGTDLEELSVPALVLRGEDEDAALAAQVEALAAVLPAARSQVIENAGHMAPLEQPAVVAGAVAGFLSGLAS